MFTITCVNDRASGGIVVNAVWTGELPGGVNGVALRRYRTGELDYTTVYREAVSSAEDLTFRFTDMEPVSGVSYTYESCALMDGSAISMRDATVVCRVEGIVLSDGNGTWHSSFGTSESRFTLGAQKNRPVSYIMTLSGKYPHRVSNSQANYWTGTCNALWLPFIVTQNGTCVEPTVEDADAYRLAFMEWLMSDTEKLMRTEDGKAMMISIDGTPQENYSPLTGLTTVSFDWTQIGAAPESAGG